MPSLQDINLHPTSHLPSSLPSKAYDVICIGSGWAASVIGARVVKDGMTALIVEAEIFGGDCPYWACVPSKVFLRPAEALHDIGDVPGARERLGTNKSVETNAVFERRDTWTTQWQDDKVLVPLLEESGVQLVRGHGKLIGEKLVEVKHSNGDIAKFEAREAVVICTGSEPVIPDIPGLAAINPWTNREATSTSQVPQSLAVLGAGAVGCEMASAFASFGTAVSLISSTAELLPRMDPEAGAVVRNHFVKRGMDVHVSTRVAEASLEVGGLINLRLSTGENIRVSQVLIATGRKCRTEGIGLDLFNISTDGSPLKVDDSLRVSSVPGNWLYAAGDVNGRHPMSHGSKYHGRIVANAIKLQRNPAHENRRLNTAMADNFAVPQVIFTLPEVASVGLTRGGAKSKSLRFKEVNAPVKTEGAQLRAEGYEDGWAQWIVEEDSGKLLGATFAGDNVAELLHASTMAVVGGMTLETMSHAVPSFPTMSEVYLNLLEAAGL